MFPKSTPVLVVDDSSTSRDLIRKFLAEIGFYDVILAENGELAIEELNGREQSQAPIQLIIADVVMPRIDGIQFLNYVRKSHVRNDIPYLLVTAEGGNDMVLEAIHAKASGYIMKPLTLKGLVERLGKIWSQIEKTKS